jgi:hypothetical protein
VGFEPTYSLLDRNSISSRARYDLFGTSPATYSLSELDRFFESKKQPSITPIAQIARLAFGVIIGCLGK